LEPLIDVEIIFTSSPATAAYRTAKEKFTYLPLEYKADFTFKARGS